MDKFVPPSKELLIEEYSIKKKTIKEIANDHGYAVGTIFNYLKKYGIETRKEMSEEIKQKMSLSRKGKTFRSGFKLSEEHKRHISESKKRMWRSPTEYGGHMRKRPDGYIKVYVPDHPFASKDGYVMEHILVMEKHIGRYITRDEVVHHINHIRDDNRIENLRLMTFKEHAGLHMKERWEKKKGVRTY